MEPGTNADSIAGILDRTPEFSELAARHGPFFFGVFLVLVAVVLILLNKNRYITSLFAGCGILFMVSASLLYFGIGNRIHIYTMRIDNMAVNHVLALSQSTPRIYRHNRVHDLDRDAYHVDLVAISPGKLADGHPFHVFVREQKSITRSDGIEDVSHITHRLPIPFIAQPLTVYSLNHVAEDGEEEGFGRYQLVAEGFTEFDVANKQDIRIFINPAVAHDENWTSETDGSSNLLLAGNSVSPKSTAQVDLANIDLYQVNPEVIYFRRSVDADKVIDALAAAGVRYGIRESKLSQPTNAVWVGVDVDPEAAENIGKALLQQGVDLRFFGFFTYRDTKTNLVQIGYSASSAESRLVSESDIEAFGQGLREIQAQDFETRQKQEEVNRIIDKRILKNQQKY